MSKTTAPPQHPAALARRPHKAQRAAAAADAPVQQVYTPGYVAVVDVPKEDVLHLPPTSLNVTRLVLCANFSRDGSCTHGARCKFVHAANVKLLEDGTATSAAPCPDAVRPAVKAHEVHINYAWRSAEEVAYERFPAGRELRVAAPNTKTVLDTMRSELALKTRALDDPSGRRPLSHCAHFYFNRACHLGSQCGFVHAVFIDPNARKHQRAPAPASLGRSTRGSKQNGAPNARKQQVPTEVPTPAGPQSPAMQAAVHKHAAPIGGSPVESGVSTPRSFGLSSSVVSDHSNNRRTPESEASYRSSPSSSTVQSGSGYRFNPYGAPLVTV